MAPTNGETFQQTSTRSVRMDVTSLPPARGQVSEGTELAHQTVDGCLSIVVTLY